MFLCVERLRTFAEVDELPVFWSGDTVGACPLCGQMVYERSYVDGHYWIQVNPHREDGRSVGGVADGLE